MLHEIIIGLVVLLLTAEYLPFTSILWEKVGVKAKEFGEWFLKTYEYKLYDSKEICRETSTRKIKLQNFFIRVMFFITATIVVVFLEIFWELGFKGVSRSFQKSSLAHWFEQQVQSMNKYIVLALFGIPFVAMETLGIIAVGVLASGHIWFGISLYLFKVLFFIPVHFILHVGEDKLMSIPWFKRRYDIIKAILEWFKKSQTYVRVHNFSENIGSYIRGFKDLFSNSVVNMKKAFEGEDLLSEECEKLRKAIESDLQEGKRVLKTRYEEFFKCVSSHVVEQKKLKQGENHE